MSQEINWRSEYSTLAKEIAGDQNSCLCQLCMAEETPRELLRNILAMKSGRVQNANTYNNIAQALVPGYDRKKIDPSKMLDIAREMRDDLEQLCSILADGDGPFLEVKEALSLVSQYRELHDRFVTAQVASDDCHEQAKVISQMRKNIGI